MTMLALRVDHLTAMRGKGSGKFPTWAEISHCAARGGAGALAALLGGGSNSLSDKELSDLKRQIKLPLHVIAPLTHQISARLTKIAPQIAWIADSKTDQGLIGELNLEKAQLQVAQITRSLNKKKIRTYLVLGPDAKTIRLAKRLGVEGVALNGWSLFTAKSKAGRERILEDLNIAGRLVRELDLDLHIGGEADYDTIGDLSRIPDVSFLHLGSAVLARAFLVGLETAIEELGEEGLSQRENSLTVEA